MNTVIFNVFKIDGYQLDKVLMQDEGDKKI